MSAQQREVTLRLSAAACSWLCCMQLVMSGRISVALKDWLRRLEQRRQVIAVGNQGDASMLRQGAVLIIEVRVHVWLRTLI